MLIDTHAHLNASEYEKDREEVVKRALENNIWIVNVSYSRSSSERAAAIAKNYDKGVFAAVALHPENIFVPGCETGNPKGESETEDEKKEEFDKGFYRKLIKSDRRIIAIGETGLDYFRIKNNELGIKEKQKDVFKKHIELALELDKPIIIHCRNAHEDVLNILNSYFKIHNSKLRGVAHCFLGNYKQAMRYRQLGFKISFNGIITFARDYDKVIFDTPIKDILLETDCPYLAPVSHRRQRNEPYYIIEVAKKMAELKNLPLEAVENETTEGALDLFGISM